MLQCVYKDIRISVKGYFSLDLIDRRTENTPNDHTDLIFHQSHW